MHFEHPLWLLAALVIPVMWLFAQAKNFSMHSLEKHIDNHLLPYLVKNGGRPRSLFLSLCLWSLIWLGLTLGLAGPRWSFREVETFTEDQSLVIVLDLSESMNAEDIKPSRLARAKQKIEDILNLGKGVKIGLIAFAADAHMITPITEDKETIRRLLPSIGTDLMYVQGSKLAPGLDMAYTMLSREPGTNKAVLVVSDGGFEVGPALLAAKRFKEKSIPVHTMGIGTPEGAPLYKTSTYTKLQKDRLNEIRSGNYLEGHYGDQEETLLLTELKKKAELNIGKKNIFWEETFYWMIIPILPLLLFWFRRAHVFALILFAVPLECSYFKNSEELGKEALECENYDEASALFQDPYRKGIAYYRAGKFQEAEECFRVSTREEVAMSSGYNLGNALAKQEKIDAAIKAYEEVLEEYPDHENARFNLELLKKKKEKNKKNQQENKNKEPESQPDEPQQNEKPPEDKPPKSEQEQDADFWLNRIEKDPKAFLKNKFGIESKKNGTREEIDPW